MAIECFNRGPFAAVIKALNIPSQTCKASLIMDAGDMVRLETTRLVTGEELQALADAFETEGLTFAHARTVYLLEPKDTAQDTEHETEHGETEVEG